MSAGAWKTFRRNLLYAIPAEHLLRILPPGPARRLGRWGGLFYYRFFRREPARAREHLRKALGTSLSEAERERIAREVFANCGAHTGETVSLMYRPPEKRESLLTVPSQSWDRVETCRARGKGTILVLPHFGNWELMGSWMAKHLGGKAIVKQIRHPVAARKVEIFRARMGIPTISQDTDFRVFIEVLRANQFLGTLPDQDIKRTRGVFVPFFGMPAYTPAGPALLSLLTGAAILPSYCLWQDGKHHIMMEEPIFPLRTRDREQDIYRLTAAWSAVFEKVIRRYPEHWMWFHRRWKTRPEDLERAVQRKKRGGPAPAPDPGIP